ncbi:MAG: hypothetical protein CMJ28_01490 [Phycisphaerae bacterium]|nr:hypothetical protein [Phycisphaerae bacterium]
MSTEQESDPDMEWNRLEIPGVSPAVVMLMEHAIDFAGLFPPAKQSLPAAIETYAAARAHRDAWMLERFVLKAADLELFEEAAKNHLPRSEQDEPWPLSVLVRHDDEGLAEDVQALERFNEAHSDPAEGYAIADVVEIKGESPASIEAAINQMPDEVFPFFELDWRSDIRGSLATIVGGDAGAKLRTGGLNAEDFPTLEAAAKFILDAASAEVPLKGTAGMHWPIRADSDVVDGAIAHGFMNFFTAAAVAYLRDCDESDLIPILSAAADDFEFTGNLIRVDDWELEDFEIAEARQRFVISWGCCSFDDPRAGLRKLGLMPEEK